MTWSELEDKVYRLLGESAGSSRWSSDQITNFLKRAEFKLIQKLGINSSSSSSDLVAGTATYNLPTGCLRVVSVEAGDTLLQANEAELERVFGSEWATKTGSPEYFYQVLNKIRLCPIPDTSETNGLTITYHASPTQTNPSLSDIFFECQAYWAAYLASQEDPGNENRGEYLNNLFHSELKNMKRALRATTTKKSWGDDTLSIYNTIQRYY